MSAQIFSTRVADVRGSLGKMFRVEFRTRGVNFKQRQKPGFKNGGYCEHEQRRANLTTCPKRLQRKPTKKKTRRRAIIIFKEALTLSTRKSRGRQRHYWNNKKEASWLRPHAAFVLLPIRIAFQLRSERQIFILMINASTK